MTSFNRDRVEQKGGPRLRTARLPSLTIGTLATIASRSVRPGTQRLSSYRKRRRLLVNQSDLVTGQGSHEPWKIRLDISARRAWRCSDTHQIRSRLGGIVSQLAPLPPGDGMMSRLEGPGGTARPPMRGRKKGSRNNVTERIRKLSEPLQDGA